MKTVFREELPYEKKWICLDEPAKKLPMQWTITGIAKVYNAFGYSAFILSGNIVRKEFKIVLQIEKVFNFV